MINRRSLTKLILLSPLLYSVGAYARARGKITFKGKVLINGKKIRANQTIKVNDTVQTIGKNSYVQFAVNQDAFKVSNNATVTLSGHKKVSNIDVKKGSLLAVFKTGRNRKIKTINATMGIRGTGIYIDASKEQTYFCTCYGETTVHENNHKHDKQTLKATHHNPVFIKNGKISKSTTMVGHGDDGLRALEAMVGRKPSFDK